MSADNGIYILKTKAAQSLIDSDFEYRVIEAGAIENIYYNPITRSEGRIPIPEILFSYFGKEKIFRYEREALDYAADLEENCLFVEYGVCFLDHSDIVFPSHLTDADVVAYEKQVDEKMAQVKKVEQAERDVRREEALILMFDVQENFRAENGGIFTPLVAYGHLERNGKKVHGSVFRDEKGMAYFLPSDWYEQKKPR